MKTTATRALSLGSGVCQNFSPIVLAACRPLCQRLSLQCSPAASHAWVDVLIPGRGWTSLDPTHNREQTGQYVRVAIGRDYADADVPPTRGVFKGNVKVSVTAF